MAQEACLLIEDDGVEVDLSAPAMSAAAYLKQMRAERKATAEVMTRRNAKADSADSTSPEAKKQKMARQQWLEKNGVHVEDGKKDTNQTPTSLIPSEAWQLAKCQEFGENRQKMAERIASFRPMRIKALFQPNEEQWHEILLETCLPEFAELVSRFPNHTGTPPAVQMVLAIPKKHLSQLIEHLVEWSVEEGLNRPIREWIYALLLVIDLPLVQDVISALRTLAKQCKTLRSKLSPDRKADAYEYSLFIAVIGIFFVQKDVSDNF